MSKDTKINALEEEVSEIQWDVIGIVEVKKKEETRIQLSSGNTLYFKGYLDDSKNGVGFIINKRIVKHVQIIKGISDRVAFLTITLKRTCLKIIQVYAPTSAYTDQDIETFYEEITSALEEQKTRLKLIIGDFNAKLRKSRGLDTA